MTPRFITYGLTLLLLTLAPTLSHSSETAGYKCQPTPEDEMGPFYRPDAEVRNQVGTGYLLQGTVKSASDCTTIANAKVELWMTGPQGRYGDEWRATLFSADKGTYYFQSHTATDFGSRRPHIHMRISAPGYKTLVTQHYPVKGAGEGLFDLVLIPENR